MKDIATRVDKLEKRVEDLELMVVGSQSRQVHWWNNYPPRIRAYMTKVVERVTARYDRTIDRHRSGF